MFMGGAGPSFSDCPGRGNETREGRKRRKRDRRRGFRPDGGADANGNR